MVNPLKIVDVQPYETDAFIRDIVRAWLRNFGLRPSHAANGKFSRALRIILKASQTREHGHIPSRSPEELKRIIAEALDH